MKHSDTIENIVIGASVDDSDEILMGAWGEGIAFISGPSTVTWYVAPKPGGDYEILYSGDEPVVSTTKSLIVTAGGVPVLADGVPITCGGGGAEPIPSGVLAARAVKAVGDSAGTLSLSLKG